MNQARKRPMHQKVLSMILVLVMLLGLLSMSAFTLPTAASSDSAASNDDSFYRIVHLDCGRKYFTKDWIIALLNEMKEDGYNQLQLAFGNDGLRFLLADMSFVANDTTYEHDNVVSKVEAGNKAQNSSGDERWLTQSEMDEIISAAKALGIEIVPLLNLPGHANAILDIANDTYNASGSNNTLNVANSEAARNFGMAIFRKYVDYFASKGCKFFSFGADEYANDVYSANDSSFSFNQLNDSQYSQFVGFVNDLASYISNKSNVDGVKMTPRAFNDGLYYKSKSSSVEVNKGIQCCYWSSGWPAYGVASASTIAKKGHAMINTHGDYYYVLGKDDKFDSGYSYASNFNNTAFMSSTIDNPVGSMFCIWCDYPNAETEQTVAQKVRLPMRAMALRMQDKSITGMDESVVANGFNTDGTLNTGSTVIPDTSTNTKTIHVAVNGTVTKTVPGDFSGTHQTDDPDIATVTTKAMTKPKELNAVTSIESGKQYLIVNNRAKKLLTDSAYSSGLKLNGTQSVTNTADLWTITSADTGTNHYTVMSMNGKYLSVGNKSASANSTSVNCTLKYDLANNCWDIADSAGEYHLNDWENKGNKAAGYTNGTSDPGSKWTIYEITGGQQTEITFHGVTVGTTSVTISDVTYQIHVTNELPANALTADTITLEHWITNAKVTSESGGSNNLQTISREYTGVQTEDGVAVDSLAYTPVGYWEATQVYFWKGVRLDSEHKQTNENGVDRTAEGTDITHIRYLDGAWQYKTADDAWHYFVNTDQLVAYYLQKTTVTKEVETYVKDWGFGTSGTTDYNNEGQVALTVAVVYPDGAVSPAEGNMYANSTTIFNYWNNRDIGIIAPKNNSDYNISKITVTDGARKENTSANQWYNSDTITWDKKTTAAGGQWYDETEVWNKSSGTTPMVNGKTSNITWSDKNTAKLVLIYLESVVKETNLNIVYWDDTANKQINPNPIQISMAYNQGDPAPTYTTALRDAKGNIIGNKGSWSSNEVGNANYLPDDAYVVNSSNVHQTINKDMTQIDSIAGNYTSGLYEYRSADISTDGKTLTLHYGLKNTGTKTYVVDFGLPVTIPLSDLGITNLDTISWISLKQETQECLSDHGTYGTVVIDKANKTLTYTLDQTLDNEIAIPINIKFSNNDQIYSYSFHVIPATNVYYEDSFATFTNRDGTTGVSSTDRGKGYWVTDGTTNSDAKQALDELGAQTKNVYGYDPAYQNCNKFSMGSATKVTVDANTANDGNWPTATFTFKGTGFDVISLTNSDAGTVMYTVTNAATGEKVMSRIINNYYGYKYENGQWVVSKNDSTAPYQVPVIKISGLDYGTYTVTISVIYAELFDSNGDNQYSFWLDAIRVYDPAGTTLDAEYEKDNENGPNYVEVKKVILDTKALETEGAIGAVFIDGKAENVSASEYKNQGPNHEAYLAKNQAIAFQMVSNAEPASVQIGAKLASGNSANLRIIGAVCDKATDGALQLQTATDMYYELADLGWKKQENGTYLSNVITLTNAGDGIVSLTNMKFIGAKYSTAMPTTNVSSDETTVVTFMTSAAMIDEAVAAVDGVINPPAVMFTPERFEASWSRNVRKGDTATLTVKASEDVEAITVNGETINSYVERNERTGWGWWAKTVTYREFTYTKTADVTTDYTVCAVNSEGVSSDPITATLTVRTSVRDWLHGLIGKWF